VADDLPRIAPGRWWTAQVVLALPIWLMRRYRIEGIEHVPREGALLVVTNHLSDRDPPIAGMALFPRPLFYFAKRELFRNRIFGWFISGVGAFPVARGAADRNAFRTARGILKRGDALLFFPEGTRSRDGQLGAPFPGAGSLGLDPGVTVLPIGIWGSQHGLRSTRAVIGPPLPMDDITQGSRSERSQRAAERMMGAIGELVAAAGGPQQRSRTGG
jgi:1-acyl-sn-glycerol-3-phosphate acyltransferase